MAQDRIAYVCVLMNERTHLLLFYWSVESTPLSFPKRSSTLFLRSWTCVCKSVFLSSRLCRCCSKFSFSLRLRAIEALRKRSSGFSEVAETLHVGHGRLLVLVSSFRFRKRQGERERESAYTYLKASRVFWFAFSSSSFDKLSKLSSFFQRPASEQMTSSSSMVFCLTFCTVCSTQQQQGQQQKKTRNEDVVSFSVSYCLSTRGQRRAFYLPGCKASRTHCGTVEIRLSELSRMPEGLWSRQTNRKEERKSSESIQLEP